MRDPLTLTKIKGINFRISEVFELRKFIVRRPEAKEFFFGFRPNRYFFEKICRKIKNRTFI